ncbi:MAG: DUF2330 domain-containing protein [Polyangiaceae bacterium]
MSKRELGAIVAALLVAAGAMFAGQGVRDAAACGGFFPASIRQERKPSLAYEQVLIVHDPESRTEHFVREVAFRGGDQAFGFVVPTPSRPDVGHLAKSPFNALRESFGFAPPPQASNSFGSGASGNDTGAGVTVLEEKKVGSFTAFVLAADDAAGLSKWLTDNKFVSTSRTDAWLEHYVQMKFFYVAMRYDPPKADKDKKDKTDKSVRAETIRISFKSPVPYYPYFEPLPEENAPAPEARLLELWVVSPRGQLLPVAALTDENASTRWVRPMRAGVAHTTAQDGLRAIFDDELDKLLPSGELTVSTFQDQKRRRVGYGDMLFLPAKRTELSKEDKALLAPLLGVLDPSLVPAKEAR